MILIKKFLKQNCCNVFAVLINRGLILINFSISPIYFMKKILLSLFWIITLWLLNFWSCSTVSSLIDYIAEDSSVSLSPSSNILSNIDTDWYYCFVLNSSNCPENVVLYQISHTSTVSYWYSVYVFNWWVACLKPSSSSADNIFISSYNWSSCNVNYSLYRLDELLVEQLPTLSSNECKSIYNLVDSSLLYSCQSDLATATWNLSTCQSDLLACQNSGSSCPTIDTQYCMINWLCPSVSGSWTSNIYIYSDNQYTPLNSATNIYVNLPSYVWYNHSYSNWWNDLDITVWYIVNTWYIENVNNQQSYIPTTEDFSNVFGNIWTFGALLVVCLFVILVFYMIKKIFS